MKHDGNWATSGSSHCLHNGEPTATCTRTGVEFEKDIAGWRGKSNPSFVRGIWKNIPQLNKPKTERCQPGPISSWYGTNISFKDPESVEFRSLETMCSQIYRGTSFHVGWVRGMFICNSSSLECLPDVLHVTCLVFASLSSATTTIDSMFAWGWSKEVTHICMNNSHMIIILSDHQLNVKGGLWVVVGLT